MTVDYLIDWFSTIGDFPILAFILAVIISGIPLFLLMALNAMVAVYAERKVSAFMMDRIGPMGQGPGLHAGKWGLLQTVADAIKLGEFFSSLQIFSNKSKYSESKICSDS